MNKEEINEIFEYRDGNLYWKIKPSQNTLKFVGS